MRIGIGAAAVLGACLVAGCGSGSSSPSNGPKKGTPPPVTSQHYVPSQGNVAACAHAGKAIALPAKFPAAFPFPAGTVIDHSGSLPHGIKGVGIAGFVPSSSFASTVNYFIRQVARSGFKVLYHEIDAPHDSEGQYRGFGVVGEWQLRALAGCPKAMSIAVSAEPGKQKP